jgi:hypothetical protein
MPGLGFLLFRERGGDTQCKQIHISAPVYA